MAGAIGVEMDLRDPGTVRAAVEQAADRLGPIDIVVLNGGGPPRSQAASIVLDEAREAAELLLFGPLSLISATLPAMRERRWGRIVGVGSSAVQQPIPGLATSAMFRAALAAHLKLLAAEVASDGVTVNMVLPGRIATERVAMLDAAAAERSGQPLDAVQAASRATIPAARYGSPEEFAAVVAFLSGPSASYVTGEQIRVDGGLVRSY
jgi:3-oxoacyl-[acyl-carrier protein] reductase